MNREYAPVTAVFVGVLLACLCVLTLTGCGGTGASNNLLPEQSTSKKTGIMAVTIVWPPLSRGQGSAQVNTSTPYTTSRLVPANAQSARLLVVDAASNVVANQVIAYPTATASLLLPVGNLKVTGSFYASKDGSGVPLAQATLPFVITANQTTDVVITTISTVDHIDMAAPPTALASGQSFTLVATPRDVSNAVVPVAAGNLTFSSDNVSVASVDAKTGVVTAGTVGSAHITVLESDSRKTQTVTILVHASVTITPSPVTLNAYNQQQFSASILGVSDQSVTWSVQESKSGGSIDSTGLYTAPSVRGVYHVIATSVADPTQTATVIVTVLAGSAYLNVN